MDHAGISQLAHTEINFRPIFLKKICPYKIAGVAIVYGLTIAISLMISADSW